MPVAILKTIIILLFLGALVYTHLTYVGLMAFMELERDEPENIRLLRRAKIETAKFSIKSWLLAISAIILLVFV